MSAWNLFPGIATLAAVVVLTSVGGAQTCWSEVVVSTHGATSLGTADMDGDGDSDVLSASTNGKIDWLENGAGDGSSWIPHAVSTSVQGATSIACADVDGDGDLDVFSTFEVGQKIAWHENRAGDGSSWVEHDVAADPLVMRVYAADVDGDGDMDAITASRHDSASPSESIAWHENTAGDGSVWLRHAVVPPCTIFCHVSLEVLACDMDGDGDADVVSAGLISGIADYSELVWFENVVGDGSAWNMHSIGWGGGWYYSLSAADLNGDGDMDVISSWSGSFVGGGTFSYDNALGDGTVWTEFPITGELKDSVLAADVDGDGDSDVLSGPWSDWDRIAWHENVLGDGSAWAKHEISMDTNSASSLAVADFDGDGDLDLVAGRDDDTLYFENQVPDLIGTSYCDSLANSTGSPSQIQALGSTSVADNDLTLMACPVPNQPGIFFFGPNQVEVPLGNGNLCVSGGLIRFPVTVATSSMAIYVVDLTSSPAVGNIVGDSRWNFQFWYRDSPAGGAFYNLSDAVRINFTP